jgi:hypothetical protein
MGIGAALPEGVILDELSLSSTGLSSNTTLKMHAKTADLADKIKTNFEKSSLFSNFSVQSSNADPTNTSGYPIEINASVFINKAATL